MSHNESIHITKHEKTPRCPDSWWADPALTRQEWMAKHAERLIAMKALKRSGYGRADGVDAQ